MQISAIRKTLFLVVLLMSGVLLSERPDEDVSGRYRGEYLGQMPPGHKPEPFAEELLSVWGDHGFHLSSCVRFSPDGCELFFSNHIMPLVPGKATSIWRMHEHNGTWTGPVTAVFSSDYDDAVACYSHDGDTLYFNSLRPSTEKGTLNDSDIWYVTKEGDEWSRPVRLGHPVNTVYSDVVGAVTEEGTMYFSSDRPGGKGGADVYCVRPDFDEYVSLVNLGTAINSAADEHVVFVSADESFMMIRRSESHNAAQDGLYMSHNDPQLGWIPAKSMGDHFKALNAVDVSVSGDGKYLFFLSQGNGVYWMKTGIIDYLKTEDLEISIRLISTMRNEGLQAAVLTCRVLQEQHTAYIDINEHLLNQRGHQLLATKHSADAIALFEVIVALFPRSWNAYDSLGEAYLASGQIDQAKRCYERSLELNQHNENAAVMLERINGMLHH